MTELELFHQCIPDIAEIIVDQRDKTQEQRMQWKRAVIEYAKSLSPFVCEFIRKTLMVIDNYLEKDEGARMMKVDDIKIYPCFSAQEPSPEKMQQKEQYFQETGRLQSTVILDSQGYLIDGYTSFLLARAHGIQCVPFRYGRRQIVRASHKPGGMLYAWEVPGILIGRVSAGDQVLVRTALGIRVVIAEKVEDYAGDGPEPLKMAIRVKRKRNEGRWQKDVHTRHY